MNRKYILLIVISIIAGSILANIIGPESINEWHIFTEDYTYGFSSVNVDFRQAAVCVLLGRIRLLLAVIISAHSDYSKIMAGILMTWMGFCMGAVCCAVTMQVGMSYYPIIWLALFAYILLYLLFIGGILIVERFKNRNVLMFMTFVAGIVAETLVETRLLPGILLHFGEL